jgi:hypothetical protein
VKQEEESVRPSQPSSQHISQRSQLVRDSEVRERQYRARMQRMNREEQNAFNELYRLDWNSRAPQASAVNIPASNRFAPLRHKGKVSDEELEHKYDDALNGVVNCPVPSAPQMGKPVPQAPPLNEALVLDIHAGFWGRRGNRRVQFQRDLRQKRRVLNHARPFRGPLRLVLGELVERREAGREGSLPHFLADEMVGAPEPMEYVPPPALSPRDPKEDGPGDGIIGYRDRRMLNTLFETRNFDYLDFLGKWNPARVSEHLFVKHFGLHFNERQIEVRLPASLVAEMKDWWSHRVRDADWENFLLSVARCRVLVSELAITADEQHVANMYAPAIAFLDTWDEQQNVSRVVQRAHVDLRRRTWPKVQQALRTRTGKVVAVGAGVCVVVGVVGVVLGRNRIKSSASSLTSLTFECIANSARVLSCAFSGGSSSIAQILLGGWWSANSAALSFYPKG